MLFSEPFFLFLFLPVLLAAYYTVPNKARNIVLSVASLIFYAFGEWAFLGWLVASIALNYYVARGIEVTRGTPRAKHLLIFGISSDLALLIVFKYAGFITKNINSVLGWAQAPLLTVPHLILPLGISFFTFHKISYKVDVFRGVAEAKKKPLDLALYILLFPQLIAGPIVRYHEIASELVGRVTTRADFAYGIRRFVIGLGKKMIIANTVAYCADQIFEIPSGQLTTGLAWLGITTYALQIYFDFSGYSDMALGLARMFGFHFPENFNYPYISASITEFWRRWHMSLSRWFKDYLYIPLGGNRQGTVRTYFNLVTVFFLCGLWHGSSWNFVLWGMFHGLLLVTERIGLGRWLTRVPRVVRHIYTLLMVLIGWVFFRADSVPAALQFLSAMAGLGQGDTVSYNVWMYLNRELIIMIVLGLVAAMPVRTAIRGLIEHLDAGLGKQAQIAFRSSTAIAGILALGGIFVYAVMMMAAGTYNPFIYYRF